MLGYKIINILFAWHDPFLWRKKSKRLLFPCHQFGHCPKAREGPALGCNYCWNTTDSNGRILRRKTKYHCPECQANLCIVPCFQQYHEALEREKGGEGEGGGGQR